MPHEIERVFPKAATNGYVITSPEDFSYNCIAWAAGPDQTDKWWWPPEYPLELYLPKAVFWPTEAPPTALLPSFISAFATLGYSVCENPNFEPAIEKVALYADADGKPTHAARQLENGEWTSKLGEWEDIRHINLQALEGDIYGTVAVVLSRPRR